MRLLDTLVSRLQGFYAGESVPDHRGTRLPDHRSSVPPQVVGMWLIEWPPSINVVGQCPPGKQTADYNARFEQLKLKRSNLGKNSASTQARDVPLPLIMSVEPANQVTHH